MIYDCFTFFNELDLLEIRLNILSEIVDKFVLIEADRTFTNLPKQMYFQENKDRFSTFLDKIIYIPITQYPYYDSPWTFENHQRNMILNAVHSYTSDDVLIISDVDEIPSPDAIRLYNRSTIMGFEQVLFSSYLNFRILNRKKWTKARILTYEHVLTNETEKYSYHYCEFLPEKINKGVTANKIRMLENVQLLQKGGWHFSYIGGLDSIRTKLNAFSHQEFNTKTINNEIYIQGCINKGRWFFNKYDRYAVCGFSNMHPYLQRNIDKYSHLIAHTKPKTSIYFLFFGVYYSTKSGIHCLLRLLKKTTKREFLHCN